MHDGETSCILLFEREYDKIDLYDSNSVILEFVALSYVDPSKNQYAYRLRGVDEDWVYCGNDAQAVYRNLSPGRYVFEVKGANGDGVWGDEISTLDLEIHPLYIAAIWHMWHIFCC